MMSRGGGAVLVCPKCSWTGESRDLADGAACPRCGERKFSHWFELWMGSLSWALLVGLLAYAAIQVVAR